MSWEEEYEARQKKIREEMDVLMIHYSQDELEKRFFKNFGCINFISGEPAHELNLAREFHKRHVQLHPEQHDKHEYEKYRCYHVTTCKCGYEEACDSSD